MFCFLVIIKRIFASSVASKHTYCFQRQYFVDFQQILLFRWSTSYTKIQIHIKTSLHSDNISRYKCCPLPSHKHATLQPHSCWSGSPAVADACIRFTRWHWDKGNSSRSLSISLSSASFLLLPSRLPWKGCIRFQHALRKSTVRSATWVRMEMAPIWQSEETDTGPRSISWSQTKAGRSVWITTEHGDMLPSSTVNTYSTRKRRINIIITQETCSYAQSHVWAICRPGYLIYRWMTDVKYEHQRRDARTVTKEFDLNLSLFSQHNSKIRTGIIRHVVSLMNTGH